MAGEDTDAEVKLSFICQATGPQWADALQLAALVSVLFQPMTSTWNPGQALVDFSFPTFISATCHCHPWLLEYLHCRFYKAL